jgi:hypothetical protein
MYILQKKYLGVPNTIPDALYSTEFVPSILDKVPSGYPYLHQTKLYAQTVPLSNPMAFIENGIATLNSNFQQDKLFVNSNYSCFGCNMISDTNSSRYFCSTYPYICFYSNLLLSPIGRNQDRFSATLYSNFTTTYAHPLLQNSISQSYDITYYPVLYTNTNNNVIYPSDGYWIIDNDTGVLMFFDSNTTVSQVNSSNPPRISFFRYEGLFGEANFTTGQYL